MTAVTGASGGVPGLAGQQAIPRDFYDANPDWSKELLTIGRGPRAGHDRHRWESVRWEDYRAKVGVQQRRGPWRIELTEGLADGPDRWVAEAEGLPYQEGWYTTLIHDDRGVVMSDFPAEVAGCLPFLDRGAALDRPRLLIGGLGLGIVPAWLLARTTAARIDVIEIDAGLIAMMTGDWHARQWMRGGRFHLHHGDALTWWPGRGVRGCVLHRSCKMTRSFDAAWWDIWDVVSPANLPSMHRLHRRFGRRAGWAMSWERAECEAMRARGQVIERPDLPGELDGWRVCRAGEGVPCDGP